MEILELKPGTPMEFSIASTKANGETNPDEEKNVYISSVFGVTKNEEILFPDTRHVILGNSLLLSICFY